MPQKRIRHTFEKGVNLDIDFHHMPPEALAFAKNLTLNINKDNSSAIAGGEMQYTPLESNVLMPGVELPSGLNYTIGSYTSEQTNEVYFFVWSFKDQHTIWVVSGDDGAIRRVYTGADLPFVLDSQYYLSEGRVTMFLQSYINPATNVETNYKFLIFTNGIGEPCFIEVESSIGTYSFTVPDTFVNSRFYNPFGNYFKSKELISLGVPTPLTQIGIGPIASTTPDLLLQNNMIHEAYQFRVKFIDIFGRESEWGIISDNYISSVGGGCIANANGQPRCVNINFGAGNPLVAQIIIGYRKWVGNDRGGALATGWMAYDTINKYYPYPGQPWWNCEINTTDPSWTWDSSSNTITYTFCGDKTATPVDDNETLRTAPGLPNTSGAVAAINQSIALSNNTYGFQPIDPAQVAKFSVTAKLPFAPCQAAPFVSVTFYACIFSINTAATKYVRFDAGKWGFGVDINRGDQIFKDQANPGFIAYPVGMQQSAVVGVQGYLDTSSNFVPLPLTSTGTQPTPPANTAWVTQFTVHVPAGKGLLRLASHKARIGDNNLQNTSTYVHSLEIISELNALASGGSIPYFGTNPLKEIAYDCSAGTSIVLNGPSDNVFLIMDCSDAPYCAAGYLVEDQNLNSAIPIEMQAVLFVGSATSINAGAASQAHGSFFTDHNGFYFATSLIYQLWIQMNLDVCDGGGANKIISINPGHCTMLYGTGQGQVPENSGTGIVGNYLSTVSYYTGTKVYPSSGRITTIQPVRLCGGTDPLPGVPVMMTKSGYGISDPDGNVTILSHNRYDYATLYAAFVLPDGSGLFPNYAAAPYSDEYLIFGQKGGCTWTTCGFCNVFSIPYVLVAYVACTGDNRVNNKTAISLQVNGRNISGLQSGGRYGYGFALYDILGRHTFVQVQPGESGFFNVPNINDPTVRQQGLCSARYTIDPTFTVPTKYVKMIPYITDNTLFSDFITWAADQVQYIDNSGGNNSVDPTAVRIYYGSLNEYNKQYNFSTNCQWEFITGGNNSGGAPTTGDVVQFLIKGTGEWIDAVVAGPITYDTKGAFFTVGYTANMANMPSGTLFRIIRTKLASDNYIYYEQNLVINLSEGSVADSSQLTGYFPFVDSYMLNRQIPVPVPQNQPWTVPPGQRSLNPFVYSSSGGDTNANFYAENNLANNSNVVMMTVIDSPTAYPFFFESPSPSDLWGSHVANRGRVNSANPYESEYRLGTEIYLSEAIGSRPYSLNGLSYFQKVNPATKQLNAVTFPRDTWGNIAVLIVETSTCVVLTENDNFMMSYGVDQLRTQDGNIVAANQYGIFTSPRKQAGTNYGCAPRNINTVRRYQGKLVYLDVDGYLIVHNFSEAKRVDLLGYSGYLSYKAKTSLSLDGYWVGGINPFTWEYYLTYFRLDIEGDQYVNQESRTQLSLPETFIIDLRDQPTIDGNVRHVAGILKGFASFTPEYYACFPGLYTQRTFLSFRQGYAWNNSSLALDFPTYCNFFGTQCFPSLHVVTAPGPDTAKRFLAMEVYVKQGIKGATGTLEQPIFYGQDILTDSNQISRLTLAQWQRQDGFWAAAFICNFVTPADPNLPSQTGGNVALDGDPLKGAWIKVILAVNPNWDAKYFSLTSVITTLLPLKISGNAQ